MIERFRLFLISALGIGLSLFTVYEVNYGLLPPLSQLALFAMLGLMLCFLIHPLHPRLKDNRAFRAADLVLAAGAVVCCGYLVREGTALQERVGQFTSIDFVVAIVGTLLVVEATRRSIGWALPILAAAFLLYAYFGRSMPDWLFPHRGYDVDRIAAHCFLGSEGIFGIAMRVMFTYVFLFVVFGAFLEISGATQFIIDFAKAIFGRSPGGPAKVAVLGSGLMGSLSGSAVANAVTTGTFTIPMMRSAGFQPHVTGGITAAAASGGALVPPVMGAGAYMMLEIIDPPVTFLQIVRAALIPAALYYLSILLIVHFYSCRVGAAAFEEDGGERRSLLQFEGLIFFGALGALIGFLLLGYTPFRAVTYSLEVILLLAICNPKLPITAVNRGLTLVLFVAATGLVGWYRSGSETSPLAQWTTWADAAIPAMVLVMVLSVLQLMIVRTLRWLAIHVHTPTEETTRAVVLRLRSVSDPNWGVMVQDALVKAARNGIALVAAAGCVGIIIGVVTLTGIGTAFPNAVVPLAQQSLFLALLAIMVCSIILGMGLPSAVCYLLMATLIGPVLSELGVIPLAAHLFIFYFGMMSMVTPPVALAAYASASIAGSDIMRTALAAFVFALVGFTLPYMFVYRPELLMMSNKPELSVVSSERQSEEVRLVGRLEHIGEGLADAKLRFDPSDGSESDQTAVTDLSGRFEVQLGPGDWTVAHLEPDGDRRHLGTLALAPGGMAAASPPGSAGRGGSQDVARFRDERLSVVQVILATGAAALGILALAAGIAGYLFTPLSFVTRVLSFGTAALLLFPGRGVAVGDFSVPISDVAGLLLFGAVAIINRRSAPKPVYQVSE